ncbi:MAG: CRISPR-associated helicase Cas3' [Psychrilyobacter sp.]|uniref:CRISPR-associated helicase Cas3' n=1 Tax=Psychrilyobacter sp. TaxID=2586924 RepID=UPI003C75B2A5
MLDLKNYLAKPNESIREHTDNLLRDLKKLKDLGYIKDKKLYELAKESCEYHDYGKVNKYFQKRINASKNGKKIKFDEDIEIGHNILSTLFIDEDEFESYEEYLIVYNAVLNHHSRINNIDFLSQLSDRNPVLRENLDVFQNEIFGICDDLQELRELKDTKNFILVKGLLHRCDYSASSRGDGDEDLEVEYPNDFLLEKLDNFMNKKNYELNDLQEFCRVNSNKNIIGIAQTGMGKTEAGLYWIGNNKGFFILPLKTAINAIYERCKEHFTEEGKTTKQLGLLHGDNLAYYIKQSKDGTRETTKNNDEKMFTYHRETKKYSQPLNISTPDQLFDFVFKYDGYEFKVTILSYSKLVIDEIQMYSPDVLAYLINGLKMVSDLGGKFCILTATFAPFVKDLFEASGIKIDEYKEFVNEKERHFVEVREEELNIELIKENYLEKKGKVLVVCNTIKKAQEVYDELKILVDVNLFHSRYIKVDRRDKEDEILRFAENSENRENTNDGIWIATQVVEASLDIDFDYLYTELSDINGLFQRFGRCNRSGRKINLAEPNCFVFTEINPRLIGGMIHEEIYNLSKEALLEFFKEPKIINEREKIDMINKYFTTENLRRGENSEYLRDFNYSMDKLKHLAVGSVGKNDAQKMFRDIHNYNIIPKDVYVNKKIIIEENLKKIEISKNYSERIKSKESIKDLSVSIPSYAFDKRDCIEIKLDRYTSLYIAEIEYNKNEGLKFEKKTREKYKKDDEDQDNSTFL